MGRKIFKILMIFIIVSCGARVFADAGCPVVPQKDTGGPAKLTAPISPPAVPKTEIPEQYKCSTVTNRVFSLGRGVGASYFHLIDLSDKSRGMSFQSIKQEYNDTFQTLNIIDIILDDLNIYGKARQDLNKLRLNFYNALQNQDLNETRLAFVRDMFVVFYENLSQEIHRKYSNKESWLLALGFYTSFQLESLNSPREDKILLSGFEKIMNKRSVVVPQSVYNDLVGIYRLDRPYITEADLAALENNLTGVIEYFTNYPKPEPLFNEVQDLVGVWQGILFNPDNEKYDIRLIVKHDLTASMDIAGIAHDVVISDIKVVNDYFTFMFKPFGTEKMYMRFNAKLSQNIFSGEIIDVLGEKGYWVLAKTDENNVLNDSKLNSMVSYINRLEEKRKKSGEQGMVSGEQTEFAEEKKIETVLNKKDPVKETTAVAETIPVKNESLQKPCGAEEFVEKEALEEVNIDITETNIIAEAEENSEERPIAKKIDNNVSEQKNEETKEKKGITKKLKSFFEKLFSYVKFWS